MSDILEQEGIGDSDGMVLKIDIEGDEWRALRDAPSEHLARFSQILLELHGMSDYSDHNNHITRMYVLRKLNETHQVVHLHVNNWGALRIIGGIPIPDVIEVTLASRKRYSFSRCTRAFPTPLDYPNNANRADILLTLPIFTGARAGNVRPTAE